MGKKDFNRQRSMQSFFGLGKGAIQAEETESKRLEGPFLQKQLNRETAGFRL